MASNSVHRYSKTLHSPPEHGGGLGTSWVLRSLADTTRASGVAAADSTLTSPPISVVNLINAILKSN